MLVKAVINDKYTNTEVHVCKDTSDEEVKNLINEISQMVNGELVAQAENGDREILNRLDIVRFYADNQKVAADVAGKRYTIAKKLYELEGELDEKIFFRISKSEIINLKKIQKLDMSFTGTIKIVMKDNSESYTSRRNVVKLKKVLGL